MCKTDPLSENIDTRLRMYEVFLFKFRRYLWCFWLSRKYTEKYSSEEILNYPVILQQKIIQNLSVKLLSNLC